MNLVEIVSIDVPSPLSSSIRILRSFRSSRERPSQIFPHLLLEPAHLVVQHDPRIGRLLVQTAFELVHLLVVDHLMLLLLWWLWWLWLRLLLWWWWLWLSQRGVPEGVRVRCIYQRGWGLGEREEERR